MEYNHELPPERDGEYTAPGKIYHLEEEAKRNSFFRRVISTSQFQLVLMSLKPNEEIGTEIHPTTDQFFRIEEGRAIFVVEDKSYILESGDAITIFAGKKHNVINSSKTNDLKLYTIYVPPAHPPGTVQPEKKE